MNLVISAVGDQSYHKFWVRGKDREFHLMLIYYGASKDKYKEDADYYLQTSGMFKLENIAFAINKYPEIIKNYKAVFMPDDDMFISTASINYLFRIFHKYKLDLAQPTIYFGKCPHPIMRTRFGSALRYAPIVDMGCPIFKTEILLETLPLFKLNRSGWGIDYLWSEKHKDRRKALIDCVRILHMKMPRFCDTSSNYYDSLEKLGVNPCQEMEHIFQQYKLTCSEEEEMYGGVKLTPFTFFLENFKVLFFYFISFLWGFTKLSKKYLRGA